MIAADPVAWAKFRNDERTRVAQAVLLDARDRARVNGQYVNAPDGRRPRLFLDELDATYRLAHLREYPPLRGVNAPKPLTRKELRDVALAMFGGTVHRRPHVGPVLDLGPVPSEAGH
ncbi:hypothetical protein [Micromonospora sp. NPDC005305]|uniref:hypothetical protein n=1 Tax=Micromonospora sp. NPDC005305 TaxID=3156875 RepID=UPI0033AAD38A